MYIIIKNTGQQCPLKLTYTCLYYIREKATGFTSGHTEPFGISLWIQVLISRQKPFGPENQHLQPQEDAK